MTKRDKVKWVLFYALFNCVTYFLVKLFVTNDYSFLSSWDLEIPFIPEFIWIYHTLLPTIFLTLIYRFNSKKEFYSNIFAIIIATFIINLCYLIFPSFYPYPEFHPETISEYLTWLTHTVDGASNTMPSGHVTFACLMLIGVYSSNNSRHWPLYLLWTLGTCCATLFLKQHYIVDVIAGILLSIMTYSLGCWIVSFKQFKIVEE